MSVLAVTLIACISMVACGGKNSSNNPDTPNTPNYIDTNICNIDNLSGIYANFETQIVYYISGETYKIAKFTISNAAGDNGLFTAKVYSDTNLYKYGTSTKYFNKLKITRNTNTKKVFVEKVWNDNPQSNTYLIRTADRTEDNDLSKQFYAEDDQKIYSKFSSLTEMFAEAFPEEPIDPANVTLVDEDWKDLFLAA